MHCKKANEKIEGKLFVLRATLKPKQIKKEYRLHSLREHYNFRLEKIL